MPEDQADLLIYGSPVSPFVRKVMAFAIAKSAAFDIEPVNIMDAPDWFPEISPLERIPVLRDRSVGTEGAAGTIPDSSAICAYLEKKHTEPALYPQEPFAHGRALFIEEYADTRLAPAMGMGIFRPIFFNLVQGKEPDVEAAKEAWAMDVPGALDYLEKTLGSAEYFAGDALSIADIAVTCCFMQGSLVAKTPLDGWPALAKHQKKLQGHPAIAGPFAKADGFIRKALPTRFDLA